MDISQVFIALIREMGYVPMRKGTAERCREETRCLKGRERWERGESKGAGEGEGGSAAAWGGTLGREMHTEDTCRVVAMCVSNPIPGCGDPPTCRVLS